jgi:site-specific recombinase XerD
MGYRGVQKMLRKYLKKAGIEKASVRTLRHTFGANNTLKGTSLKAIQEAMGLQNIRSLSIYLNLAKSITAR